MCLGRFSSLYVWILSKINIYIYFSYFYDIGHLLLQTNQCDLLFQTQGSSNQALQSSPWDQYDRFLNINKVCQSLNFLKVSANIPNTVPLGHNRLYDLCSSCPLTAAAASMTTCSSTLCPRRPTSSTRTH